MIVAIPGKPAPMPRTRPEMDPTGKVRRMVWPAAYRTWREAAHLLVLAACRAQRWSQLTGPARIHVVATWPRPKQRPATCPPEVWQTGIPFRRPTRPDGDNVLKTAQDLLNGLAYADDGQVAEATVECWYAGRSEQPASTVIRVDPLPWLRAETGSSAHHPTTAALLSILAELHDVGGLLDLYGIDAGDDAPLDLAVRGWAEAGYPGAEGA